MVLSKVWGWNSYCYHSYDLCTYVPMHLCLYDHGDNDDEGDEDHDDDDIDDGDVSIYDDRRGVWGGCPASP